MVRNYDDGSGGDDRAAATGDADAPAAQRGADGDRPGPADAVDQSFSGDRGDSENPSDGTERPRTDGGMAAADRVEYLDAEVNIFRPATPFMRDHLKVIWGTFVVWVLFVFGPITATRLAPELMTGTIVFGFQLHFLLTALGAPLGALLLSVVYAYQRDRLDEKYGIGQADETAAESPTTAVDGGTPESADRGGERQ